MTYFVACLDVWAPAVCDVIRRVAPPDLDLHFAQSYDEAEQMNLAKEADVIFAGWAAVTRAMLENSPRLKLIEKWGVGVDRIDVQAAREMGIPLAITAGSNSGPVSELAVALMLAVYRRIAYVDRALREGQWLKSEMREICYQLTNKTVGIYGFGNIGRRVAKLLAGFDCTLLYHDERRANADTEKKLNVRYVDKDSLFGQSDVVSLHVPATPQTTHLLNAARIQSMKEGAILINTARGELVDETALYKALIAGKLLGAGLDAFAIEPPGQGNPLLELNQVVCTPHIGGAVFDNVENVARHAIGNIMHVLNGEPLAPQDVIIPVPT